MARPPEHSVDLAAFWADPYPVLADLRATAPVARIFELGAIVLTRREDVMACEKRIEIFSSDQPDGLMVRLMGRNLMRKDGAAHQAERKIIMPSFSTRTVAGVWRRRFEDHARAILDELAPAGRADLFDAYARRLSGEALKEITGLTNITWREMDAVSQGMIDGIANYAGDAETEERCRAATAAIDAAIDDILPATRRQADHGLLSVMLEAGLNLAAIRANIKLAISGGQNEPRDAIAGTIWALLNHPAQLTMVHEGRVSWGQTFEEYARWISPIGMAPRRIARPYRLHEIDLEPEERVFLMYGSANRDEAHFAAGERFDITRDSSKSIAFGAGPHFCPGAAASRTLIADVALPLAFERLPGLALDPAHPVRFGGWAFRGPLSLHATWRDG